jgi:hypothetical protein
MDHSYIDEHSVAERYLSNALAPGDRDAFERHMVDCQDCTDRILLAGIFHSHSPNGIATPAQPRPALVVRLKPATLLSIVLISLLMLLAIPVAVWLFER